MNTATVADAGMFENKRNGHLFMSMKRKQRATAEGVSGSNVTEKV